MTDSKQAVSIDAGSSGCPMARSYPFSTPHQFQLDPTYGELQRDEPIARIQMPYGGPAWLVTTQKDARFVLSDQRFSREAVLHTDPPRVRPMAMDQPETLMTIDPPEHSRVRRLMVAAFTAKRVELLRPQTEATTEKLIDDMIAAGPPVDLIEKLAFPLPLMVVTDLLGVGLEGTEIFRGAANAINSVASMTDEERFGGVRALEAYLAEIIAERRRNPEERDDLLSALIKVRDDDGDRLSEKELISLGFAVLSGGQETTMTQLGNIIWTLMQDRSRWDYLVEDPSRIPDALEELMRYIVLGGQAEMPRIATADVDLPSGNGTIKAGEAVLVNFSALNRDPAVFDHPNQLDFGRKNKAQHLAFGFGPHHCLGSSLARMELQTALRALVRRLPALRVVEEGTVWRPHGIVRGFDKLMVAW